MNWWNEIGLGAAALIGAIGGSAVAPRLLGDWLLEKVKAHHSKELAEIEHKLSILLSDRQNAFSMGISSHMATTLFDKHICFCEEYVEAISNTLYSLVQEGNREQPLDVNVLFKIRQKWALWLNDDLEVKLNRFEHGYKEMGGAQVFDAYGAALSKALGIRSVITELRKALGLEELTSLRNELVRDLVKKSASVV
jgi:hypothetical protein